MNVLLAALAPASTAEFRGPALFEAVLCEDLRGGSTSVLDKGVGLWLSYFLRISHLLASHGSLWLADVLFVREEVDPAVDLRAIVVERSLPLVERVVAGVGEAVVVANRI